MLTPRSYMSHVADISAGIELAVAEDVNFGPSSYIKYLRWIETGATHITKWRKYGEIAHY